MAGFTETGFILGGGCFFSDVAADPLFLVPGLEGVFVATIFDTAGGFQVNPLTVTVQDDTKAKLAEVLTADVP